MKPKPIIRHLIIVASACLMTGCGPAGKQLNSSSVIELRAGVMPVAECAILSDSEVFRRHGISLRFTKAASGTQISDGVIGGGLEFGFSNLVTPIIAESRQIPLRIIGPISIETDKRARHALVVRKDGKIKKPQDLKGKIIALNAFRNIDHLMILRWLEENGVDSTEVQFQTTPFPTMVTALGAGVVDVVALVEPFITLAFENPDKFTNLGNYYSSVSGKPTAVSGFVAREDWLKNNPDLARRLSSALVEAAENAEKNPEAFRAQVVTMTATEFAVVQKMPLPWYQLNDYEEVVKDLVQVVTDKKFIEDKVGIKPLIYAP